MRKNRNGVVYAPATGSILAKKGRTLNTQKTDLSFARVRILDKAITKALKPGFQVRLTEFLQMLVA
jgi:hypothetical protein